MAAVRSGSRLVFRVTLSPSIKRRGSRRGVVRLSIAPWSRSDERQTPSSPEVFLSVSRGGIGSASAGAKFSFRQTLWVRRTVTSKLSSSCFNRVEVTGVMFVERFV